MKFYLFLTIGTLIFFWAFDSSLKKSTRIHCETFGEYSRACEAIKTQNKLVEEF
tara:strand:- start:777 stop:938 length:162 start_codon:yes stop_codon:yes gene_type:complete